MKANELAELNDAELETQLRTFKEELFNLRFQMATGQLDNNRRLRTVRQEIARIYTVLRERELGLASGPDGEDSGWLRQRRRPRRPAPSTPRGPRSRVPGARPPSATW